MNDEKELVQQHYDASAKNYHLQYERNLISDITRCYPANYFRLQLLLNSFSENSIKRVLEVGVGEGTPLVTLSKAGIDVAGFDISDNMIKACQNNLKKNNIDASKIIWGDIQDPTTYTSLLKEGQFDAILAMGVLPHVRNDEFVLNNIKAIVKPSGRVFVEFRNKLFSLFTFNRYTYEFILDDLLAGVSPQLKDLVAADLKKRLAMDRPIERLTGESANLAESGHDSDVPGYDAILSKLHNPFEILDLFEKCGFSECKLLWYHYHPAMPFISDQSKDLFRDEALKLEHENSGWRGLFLCSAFVVEAIKPEVP